MPDCGRTRSRGGDTRFGPAAMRSMQDQPVALSHHSALAVQDLSTYGGDERVHVIRTDGRAGRSAGGWSWHPAVPPTFLTTHDDVCVVSGPMACLRIGCASSATRLCG